MKKWKIEKIKKYGKIKKNEKWKSYINGIKSYINDFKLYINGIKWY